MFPFYTPWKHQKTFGFKDMVLLHQMSTQYF